jgi:hypothetical protein
MTRISAGALGVTMIVAIKPAKWGDVDSLETLLGFDETEYLALFLPLVGIIVVLAVLSGMSSLALTLGLAWLAVGLVRLDLQSA